MGWPCLSLVATQPLDVLLDWIRIVLGFPSHGKAQHERKLLIFMIVVILNIKFWFSSRMEWSHNLTVELGEGVGLMVVGYRFGSSHGLERCTKLPDCFDS